MCMFRITETRICRLPSVDLLEANIPEGHHSRFLESCSRRSRHMPDNKRSDKLTEDVIMF